MTDLKALIDKLQNTPGAITPEDQALLDQAQAKADLLVTKTAITREAWCETLKEMIDGGVTDIEKLTPAEWATAVEVFICKAIELQVFNEIGIEGISEAQDVAKLDEIENDLTALIRGQVQNTIVPLIQDGQVRSHDELDQYMTGIAQRAYDYLDALGGQED